jgi:hypothetical protein
LWQPSDGYLPDWLWRIIIRACFFADPASSATAANWLRGAGSN